jgi:hypothetical protein
MQELEDFPDDVWEVAGADLRKWMPVSEKDHAWT